jgi:type II secretory pathway component PulF
MITAGIPILETIDSLLEDAKGNAKKILEAVREDLIQGKHLYSSFARFPGIFDKVTVNIIKASEEAGTLDVTLKDLKSQIKKDMEFGDKVKGALTYPVLILLVFFGVLLMILIVVVPKISTVFLRLKVNLPLPTLVLIYVSNILLTYTIPVVIVFAGLIAGLVFLYRRKKQLVLHALYRAPIVTRLVKEIDLTRFSRSMYLLLSSGITITSALELTKDVVLKPEISSAISYANEMVLAGKRLSDGFKERKGAFSSIMIKIIEAGEKTGTLDKSMLDISEYLDYQVSNTLRTLTTVLEPVMLVLVGILVGGMMLAIIAPIYGLIGQVSAR